MIWLRYTLLLLIFPTYIIALSRRWWTTIPLWLVSTSVMLTQFLMSTQQSDLFVDGVQQSRFPGGGGPQGLGQYRQKLDLILVALKRADGAMLFNPTLETPILAGDTLIALGMRHNLEALEKMLR